MFFFPDVLSVIGAAPGPGSGPGPGISDENLDFDDDTLKGEKIDCKLVYYYNTLLILRQVEPV